VAFEVMRVERACTTRRKSQVGFGFKLFDVACVRLVAMFAPCCRCTVEHTGKAELCGESSISICGTVDRLV
jgi:hypothetical protein